MVDWSKLKKFERSDVDFASEYMTGEFPDVEERMTVQEWFGACDVGAYIDYDGHAEVFGPADELLGRYIPSERNDIPVDAVYVIWYNR